MATSEKLYMHDLTWMERYAYRNKYIAQSSDDRETLVFMRNDNDWMSITDVPNIISSVFNFTTRKFVVKSDALFVIVIKNMYDVKDKDVVVKKEYTNQDLYGYNTRWEIIFASFQKFVCSYATVSINNGFTLPTSKIVFPKPGEDTIHNIILEGSYYSNCNYSTEWKGAGFPRPIYIYNTGITWTTKDAIFSPFYPEEITDYTTYLSGMTKKQINDFSSFEEMPTYDEGNKLSSTLGPSLLYQPTALYGDKLGCELYTYENGVFVPHSKGQIVKKKTIWGANGVEEKLYMEDAWTRYPPLDV